MRQLKAAHLSLSRRGHITLTVLHRQLGRIVLNIDADFDFLRGTGHRVHDLYGYLIDFGGFVRIVGIRMLRVDLRLRVDEVAAFIHAQLTVGHCRQIVRRELPVSAQDFGRIHRGTRALGLAQIRIVRGHGGRFTADLGRHVKGNAAFARILVGIRHIDRQRHIVLRGISLIRRHVDLAAFQRHRTDTVNVCGISAVLFFRRNAIDGHTVTVGTVRERICTNQRLCR